MSAAPAFHIHYATGWANAVLHVRAVAEPGQPEAPWQALPMHSTNSRGRPKGGNWMTATICATPAEKGRNGAPTTNGSRGGANGAAAAARGVAGLSVDGGDGAPPQSFRPIEFFVSSVDGSQEDRPWGGAAYRCFHPGGYKLRSGSLRPFPVATQPPMMLVGGPGRVGGSCGVGQAKQEGSRREGNHQARLAHRLAGPRGKPVRRPEPAPPPVSLPLPRSQVSDLDGTMVGDGEEADACTREFATYWEENAALAGGVLVYNTGRWVKEGSGWGVGGGRGGRARSRGQQAAARLCRSAAQPDARVCGEGQGGSLR